MPKSITPIGRVSYPYVFQPQENKNEDGSTKKSYSMVLMFDKTADLSELRKNIAAAEKEMLDRKFKGKKPPGWKDPIRDGDEKNFDGSHPEYAGMVYITLRAAENRRPQVVNADKSLISQEDGLFYAGCYARASYECYAYDHVKGNKGVGLSLGNVQKVKDGEPLDGRTSAEDDFAAVSVDSSESLF